MKLIFLHGPAAAGKYTIARELAAITGFELYHNHLVVDEVLKLHAFGSPGFIAMRDELWRAHFSALAQDTVFTFNPENSVPQGFIDWLFDALPQHGVSVHSVELLASEDAIESRLASEQRQQFKKLTDLHLYRRLRAQGVFDSPRIPRTEFKIDTETIAPPAAARRIARMLGLPNSP